MNSFLSLISMARLARGVQVVRCPGAWVLGVQVVGPGVQVVGELERLELLQAPVPVLPSAL